MSLDKSEVSILQQHGLLVVWGAGGAQVLCDLHGPGDDSEMILVSSTGPGLMTEMIDLARWLLADVGIQRMTQTNLLDLDDRKVK